MEAKKDRTDFVKFFLKLAEMAFLVLVATPAGLLVLEAEIRLSQYLIAAALGVPMMLLFLFIAYRIWRG